METQKLTPLMQQYWEIKNQHRDKIVLFRMGDFYEMFHEDAETAAPILNIALTSRNKKAGDETKMCGVPHHSIAGPIARLLKSGRRVAICDQIEDPAVAKGIVKRAVTRVLTPGMVFDPETLDQVTANFLASYDSSSVAFVDITTGEAFYYREPSVASREELLELLSPVELVLPESESRDEGRFLLSRHDGGETACQRLVSYIGLLQGNEVAQALRPFEERFLDQHLRMTATTLRGLEVFETSRGERAPTLFSCSDRTKTASGARRLKQWMAFPLTNLKKIAARQDQVAFWQSDVARLRGVRELLGGLGDLERRVGKLLSSTASARDLLALAESLNIGFEIGRRMNQSLEAFVSLPALAQRLFSDIVDAPPLVTKEGGMIRKGVRPDLDDLIDLSENANGLLVAFEAREREQTRISTLKVRYNNVFGFYIELSRSQAEKAPGHYQRKQTLTNAERFTTPELNQLEEKILSARSRRADLEYEVYMDLRKLVLQQGEMILHFAGQMAEIDVCAGLAWLALERGYCRPQLNGIGLKIEHSRHPVVEQERGKNFVANSIEFAAGSAMLLTGPNMAGKSTLMRQVALTTILAQMGSFVPAKSASQPIFTRIFARIGASDSIHEGLSTFMVEMLEAAEIVAQSDERSLIIMDEIGRGTSTYDGLSLAQAILEFLVQEKRPYLFFATHYHELSAMAGQWPQIRNAHMSIQEKNGKIAFLHALREGPANRSYGVHVARLAQLPEAVTRRAETLLKEFEAGQSKCRQSEQLTLPVLELASDDDLKTEIRQLNIAALTPLDALVKINEWQQKLT